MQKLFSGALLSADDLMKISWKMFQERFLKLLYVFLLSVVFFLLTSTVLLAFALYSSSALVTFFVLFLSFLILIGIVLVQNVMFFEIIKNKNVRLRQAMRRAIPLIKPYLGSLFLYILISLNLIIFMAFLCLFISMAAIFTTILPVAQGFSVIFGITSTFLAFFMGMAILIPIVYAYIWQYFMLFDLIIAGRGVRESLDHSFSLIDRNKQAIMERATVFILCYMLILLTVGVLATANPFFAIIARILNYVLIVWAMMFLYALYENLNALSEERPTAGERQAVSLLLRSGAVIMVTMSLLLVFSFVFVLSQTGYTDAAIRMGSALQYPLSIL